MPCLSLNEFLGVNLDASEKDRIGLGARLEAGLNHRVKQLRG